MPRTPPKPFGSCSEKSRVAQLRVHGTDPPDDAARKRPRSRSGIDGTIDVQKPALAESPIARLKSLELDGNRERAHRPFPVLVEIAVEVAQAERYVWIDRLTRAEGRVIRFRDAAPQAGTLIKREAVTVVRHRVDPHETRRVTQLPQRRAREQNAAVALRLTVPHDDARRRGAAPLVIFEFVEESL